MAKNTEIICASFLPFLLPSFIPSLPLCKPRQFRYPDKAWKGSSVFRAVFPPNPFGQLQLGTPGLPAHSLAVHTGTACVSQAVGEIRAQRLQNLPQLATIETKSDLLSPPSPESLIPVAMNGIKNTDYLTKKIKNGTDLLRSTLRI